MSSSRWGARKELARLFGVVYGSDPSAWPIIVTNGYDSHVAFIEACPRELIHEKSLSEWLLHGYPTGRSFKATNQIKWLEVGVDYIAAEAAAQTKQKAREEFNAAFSIDDEVHFLRGVREGAGFLLKGFINYILYALWKLGLISK